MSPRLSDLFLRSQSDERLVALARSGHDPAFTAIVERYRRPLLALARRLNSDGRAEDIVQQAFLGALAALRAGAEVRHLRGWLHQIVRNAAIQAGTRAPLEASRDDVADAASDADTIDEHILALTALVEVSRLPERQREAFVGTALQGRTRTEMAFTMGLTEGAVRQLVHRARSTLRHGLTALTPYPIAQWLASSPGGLDAARVVDLTASAGAASAAGVALKVSAVVATGVIAAGVVASRPLHPAPHRPPRHIAAVVHHTVHLAPRRAAVATPRVALVVAPVGHASAPRPVVVVAVKRAHHVPRHHTRRPLVRAISLPHPDPAVVELAARPAESSAPTSADETRRHGHGEHGHNGGHSGDGGGDQGAVQPVAATARDTVAGSDGHSGDGGGGGAPAAQGDRGALSSASQGSRDGSQGSPDGAIAPSSGDGASSGSSGGATGDSGAPAGSGGSPGSSGGATGATGAPTGGGDGGSPGRTA